MARIGDITPWGAIRWTGAAGATVAGSNNGKFNDTVTRTGVGVYEVTPAANERFGPADTFKQSSSASGAPATDVNTVIERVSDVLIRVRGFNGGTGAATDVDVDLRWQKVLRG